MARRSSFQPFHLARRFFGALRPGPPAEADEVWARSSLLPGERVLWERMSNPDRRHAVAVAREVVARWPGPDGGDGSAAVRCGRPDRAVIAAALLHDVGKVESGLATLARVGATLLWAVVDDRWAVVWAGPGASLERPADRPEGVRARLGRYRLHPELGAVLLRRAGSDALTASWAEEHHRPEERWTVPVAVGRLLKDCDDD